MRSSERSWAANWRRSLLRNGLSFEALPDQQFSFWLAAAEFPLPDCAGLQVGYDPTVTMTLVKEVRKLSVAEKIQLAETLWDEVAAQPDELPVPHAHKRLLDARLAAHLEAPDSAITRDEFRRRLARRL